jgi:hypothetical protein
MTGIVVQNHYQLKFSKSQFIVLLLAYFTATAMSLFYLSLPWLKWSCIGGLAISAHLEYRHLIQNGKLRLRLVPQRQMVELMLAQQPYIFRKNKVYETRWFAILRLTDSQMNRTLILNSDCFESLECYRQCRFELRRLDNSDAA